MIKLLSHFCGNRMKNFTRIFFVGFFYLNQQNFLNSLKNQYFCCFDVGLCFRNGTATK